MTRSQKAIFTIGVFIVGVLAASWVDVPGRALATIGVAGGITWIAGWRLRARAARVIGITACFFAAGAAWFAYMSAPPPELSSFYGNRIAASGIVWNEPERLSGKTQMTVRISSVDGMHLQSPVMALVTVRPYPEYSFGDTIALDGILEKPVSFSDFDYAAFLAKDGVYALMRYPAVTREAAAQPRGITWNVRSALYGFKRAFITSVASVLPEPHASFLEGLLVGERRSIPPDILDNFRKTGTMHIIALSGFNISIIAESLLAILQVALIPFAASFWIVAVFLVCFTVMVGAQASIVRAAIMGVLVLLARRTSRMYDARIALACAAGAMVLFNPSIARFDVGFQLSCAATAGLLFLSDPIERSIRWIRFRALRETLTATLAAQIAVFPLLVYYFGGISLVAPLANMAILIIIPATMLIGFCAGIIGFFSAFAGTAVGFGAWALIQYEMAALSFFASLPFSYIELSGAVSVPLFILYVWIVRKLGRRSAQYAYEKNT